MPSSSARCSQLPRAVDKVPFYVALRKLRDYLCGRLAHLADNEVTFSSVLITAPRKNNSQNPVAAGAKSGGDNIIMQSKRVKKEYSSERDDGFDCDDDKRAVTGLDDDGRPKIIGPNCVYDIRLIKEEITDDNNEEEQMNAFLARENSSAVADLTSLLDKSPYFVGLTPEYTAEINFNNGLTIFQPNLSSPQYFAPRFYSTTAASVDGDGCNGKNGNGGGGSEKNEGDETNDGDGEQTESSDNVDHTTEQPYENGSKNESLPVVANQLVAVESGSLSAQVPSAVQQTPSVSSACGRSSSLEQSSSNNNKLQSLSQQINGENSVVPIKTEPSTPIQQQHAPTSHHPPPTAHHPSTCNLPPEIALHVEEAIEAVVQRAREGPLEMPAFRTPAEKSAAAHAHQQQQHQQQMFANLQLQAAAAAAAAAHFDLSRGMKGAETVGVPAAALLGANYEQSCQASANTPSLYSQYFQQPQANQSSFPSAGAAGFGSSAAAAVGAGYGSPQWTFATATTSAAGNAVMYNHPSNMMAAASPYFQNAAAAAFPGQQLYHQGSNVNAAAAGAASNPFSSSTTPYFNQQQAAAAAQQQQSMYGNYAAGFSMQQQSPHNL